MKTSKSLSYLPVLLGALALPNAQALVVNGTTTLGGGSTSNEGNVQVGTTTAGSTLNVGDHTLNVSNTFRVGDQLNLGGTVNQTDGLVNFAQTDQGSDYNTGQFLLGHWNGGALTADYNLSGGELRVSNANTIVGWDGIGRLNVSGGVANVETITLQQGARGSGIFLSGGTINTSYLNMGERARGSGAVTQSGGVMNVTGGNGVRIGHWGAGGGSFYDMTGGELNTTVLDVGWDGANNRFTADGTADVNSGTIRVVSNSTLEIKGDSDVTGTFLDVGTNRGAGNVVQEGGTMTINGDTRLAHWSGGAGSTHTVSGGTFNSNGNYYAGWDGSGAFTATGTADINMGSLFIQRDSSATFAGDSVSDINFLSVGFERGDNAAPNSTLNIQDNATVTAANVSVGDRGSRPGDVNQSGGTFTTPGLMRIGHWGNETSTYNMSGGSLNLTGTPSANTNTNSGNNDASNPGVLYLGIDGTGIMNHSGGDISAHGLVLDNRTNTPGIDQDNMTGGTLALKSTGIKGNSGGSYEVNLGAGTVRADESFGIETPVTLTDSATGTTFDTNGNTITVSNVLSGTGALVKDGDGVLDLTVNNTYTGGTTILDGVVLLSEPTNNSVGNIRGEVTVEADGTLRTSTTNSLGWGGGTKINTINLNGGTLDNTATGDQGWGLTVNLADGALMQSNGGVNSANAPSYFSLGGGSQINSLAGATTNTIRGTIRIRESNAANTLDFNVADGAAPVDLRVEAGIREQGGARNLSKSGDGTMEFTGSGTYTGNTDVNGGVLLVSAGGAITQTGNASIAAGATLQLLDGNLTTPGVFDIATGGALDLSGGGDLTAGNTTWGGSILDSTPVGDALFTETDGTLASTATSTLDLQAIGNVFDLVGGLDLGAGGTLDGFDLIPVQWAAEATEIAPSIYELLLVDATGAITGDFANELFPNGDLVADGIGNLLLGGQYFVDNRGSQLYLVANIPEPSRALLLLLGLGIALLRRRR